MTRITAGELSKKALSDQTKYDALEVGHHLADNIAEILDESIQLHLNILSEQGEYSWRKLSEFCVVMQIAEDPLIKNLKRRKFYCCPFLPSPRPNQAVFLYSKSEDRITKRLWVLPSDIVMAELSGTNIVVHKRYETMQAWSVAFFKGQFWEYIRHEHNIKMLSQSEYISNHRKELIEAGCKIVDPSYSEPFDFSKIEIKKIVDTQTAMND